MRRSTDVQSHRLLELAFTVSALALAVVSVAGKVVSHRSAGYWVALGTLAFATAILALPMWRRGLLRKG